MVYKYFYTQTTLIEAIPQTECFFFYVCQTDNQEQPSQVGSPNVDFMLLLVSNSDLKYLNNVLMNTF